MEEEELMKILVVWDITAFRFVYEIEVSEKITASFCRVDQDLCLGYPSDGDRNTFQNVRTPYTNLQNYDIQ
jgi:hypothetical protein